MTEPLISIIIPVKNGAFWLNELLPALQKQTLFHRTEMILIDSGSTDDTVSIIRQHPAKSPHDPA